MLSSVWRCCPGGERVVSGSRDKTLKVWKLAGGSCETILQGHKRVQVFCVAVLPGGTGWSLALVTRPSRSEDCRTEPARRLSKTMLG